VRASVRTASLLLLFVPAIPAQLVKDVRLATRDGDFAGARQLVEQYRASRGATPELAAAVSWLARGALGAKDYRQAERHAAEARRLALDLSKESGPDSDRDLATALGASIEVHGQALAAQGALSEAIAFLNGELARWHDTSLRPRIQKNIHLLSLEGKPAPPSISPSTSARIPSRCPRWRARWCCCFSGPTGARTAKLRRRCWDASPPSTATGVS
jgi:hypothetical protein